MMNEVMFLSKWLFQIFVISVEVTIYEGSAVILDPVLGYDRVLFQDPLRGYMVNYYHCECY
jgi:hypothetical protein